MASLDRVRALESAGRASAAQVAQGEARLAAARHEYDLTRGGLDELQARVDACQAAGERARLAARLDACRLERERLLAAHRRATEARWAPGNEWATPAVLDLVEEARDGQGHTPVERAGLSGRVVAKHPQDGGTNETWQCVLSDGTVWYHKPFSGLHGQVARRFGQTEALQPIHEAAAWRLAERLGGPWASLVPVCVVRDVEYATSAGARDELGSFAAHRAGREDGDHMAAASWEAAAFFDALIGQQDRHGGNYLMDGPRLALIDHGYAFARPGDRCNSGCLQEDRQATSPALTPVETSALSRLLASPDLLGVRRCLEPDRAAALEGRARRMLASGVVLASGDY
jgi:hypothetical protein